MSLINKELSKLSLLLIAIWLIPLTILIWSMVQINNYYNYMQSSITPSTNIFYPNYNFTVLTQDNMPYWGKVPGKYKRSNTIDYTFYDIKNQYDVILYIYIYIYIFR